MTKLRRGGPIHRRQAALGPDYFNMSEADWAAPPRRCSRRASRSATSSSAQLDGTAPAGSASAASRCSTPQGAFRGYRGIGKDVIGAAPPRGELRRFRTAMDRFGRHGVPGRHAETARCIDFNDTACRDARLRARGAARAGTSRAAISREEIATRRRDHRATRTMLAGLKHRRLPAQGRQHVSRSRRGAPCSTPGRPDPGRDRARPHASGSGPRSARRPTCGYQESIARFGQSALAKRDAARTRRRGGAAGAARAERRLRRLPRAGARRARARAARLAGCERMRHGHTARVRVRRQATRSRGCSKPAGSLVGERLRLPFDWARPERTALVIPVRDEQKRARPAVRVFAARAGAFGAEESNFVDAAASVLSAGLQRIDSEARLAFLAQFDALTGLPNRALLADRFSQMIVQRAGTRRSLGVLFIDLDQLQAGERHAGPRRRRRAARGDRAAAAARRCARATPWRGSAATSSR